MSVDVDVAIVGGGPAGLSAARALVDGGAGRVVVLEREAEAGGIPRHCGHTGYGLREFRRLLTGPAYARRLVAEARGADLRTGTTVLGLDRGGLLDVIGPRGREAISARHVLLATGARETPRSARLVGGTRPWGVMNTGALQQFAYLSPIRPFRRAVIVGTELVSFSALLTLRHAGIDAVAMIDEAPRIAAPAPGDWIARLLFDVPVLLNTRLAEIEGAEHVTAIVVERGGERLRLACDGVVMSGRFVPETALIKASHIMLDGGTNGPSIDQHFRTTHRAVFAAGNLLHPIETAGIAWAEGRAAATAILADRAAPLPDNGGTPILVGGALRYVYPQRLVEGGPAPSPLQFRARATKAARGRIEIRAGDDLIFSRNVRVHAEQRIALPAEQVLAAAQAGGARIDLIEDRPA